MKVYSCPDECPAPTIDFANYDATEERRKEEEHKQKLTAWLKDAGYTGAFTGETVSFPVADGYAIYMLADGKPSCLIHLPYGDGWHYRDVEFLPKREILKRIQQQKQMASIFDSK